MNYQCKYCYTPFKRKDNLLAHESKRGKTCRVFEKIIRAKVLEAMRSTEKLFRDDCEVRVQEAVAAERERLTIEHKEEIRKAVLDERERLFKLFESSYVKMLSD